MTKKVTYELPSELHHFLKTEAARRKVTMSELLHEALKDYLPPEEVKSRKADDCCACQCPDWQAKFGGMQPCCSVCQSIEDLLSAPKSEQVSVLRDFFSARFLVSSWLATIIPDDLRPSLPRDVLERAAGWRTK